MTHEINALKKGQEAFIADSEKRMDNLIKRVSKLEQQTKKATIDHKPASSRKKVTTVRSSKTQTKKASTSSIASTCESFVNDVPASSQKDVATFRSSKTQKKKAPTSIIAKTIASAILEVECFPPTVDATTDAEIDAMVKEAVEQVNVGDTNDTGSQEQDSEKICLEEEAPKENDVPGIDEVLEEDSSYIPSEKEASEVSTSTLSLSGSEIFFTEEDSDYTPSDAELSTSTLSLAGTVDSLSPVDDDDEEEEYVDEHYSFGDDGDSEEDSEFKLSDAESAEVKTSEGSTNTLSMSATEETLTPVDVEEVID